ncbi:MFS transporter, partial [Vibrio sp. FNV 38]|nr:MFS transporter [Vibrio sp. FNV 38]
SSFGELSLLLVASLTIMVGAALAPGLNTISQALGVSEYATFLITLPALGAILFAPIFGALIDSIGARRTLLMSLFGYFLFGAGGALLYGAWPVALNRIILGGFAAGSMASGTALISLWYAGPKRLSMIAKQGMAIELGGAIFLFLGGILSEFSWKGPFGLYALALICFILVITSIPSSKERTEEVAIDHSDQALPMRSVITYTILSMALFFSLFVIIPQHLAELQFSEAQTGYLLSFISATAVVAAMIMPRMVGRFDESITLTVSFISFTLAHALLAYSSSTSMLIFAALSAGIGFGFSIPLLNNETVKRSSDKYLGRYLSWFAMAVFFGQFITSTMEFIPLSFIGIFKACAFIGIVCAGLISRFKLG